MKQCQTFGIQVATKINEKELSDLSEACLSCIKITSGMAKISIPAQVQADMPV